jgi:hypothetical protein
VKLSSFTVDGRGKPYRGDDRARHLIDLVIFVDLGYGRTVSLSTSPLLADQAN